MSTDAVYKQVPLESEGPQANGWLDPAGKFWDIGNWGHMEFATQWLYPDTEEIDPRKIDPVTELEKLGWLHISDGDVYYRKKPTARQQDVLYDWIMSIKKHVVFKEIPTMHPENLGIKEFLDRFAKRKKKLSKRS